MAQINRPTNPGAKDVLLEAYAAAAALLSPQLRREFVLVGGAAIVALGGDRATEEVEVAVMSSALHDFKKAARRPDFKEDEYHNWYYIGKTDQTAGIEVRIDFLEMGSDFTPSIIAEQPIVGGFRAGLGELALMKARAWLSEKKEKDRNDFQLILSKMEMGTETFRDIEIGPDDLEHLRRTARAIGDRTPAVLEALFDRPSTIHTFVDRPWLCSRQLS
ncbi:MAG: hypothetical protein M1817_000255 [Caeruleum heppii]|nr:MAG: hypothetical protein M1817_000255 [Caeruleum heppii]